LLPYLPGLKFRLFGFPVSIGLDFLLITFLIGARGRDVVEILEWIVVVAVSLLIHELGHSFALQRYGIHPEIRLWGFGGLTVSGFVLPPSKAIVVSLAGPLVGIPAALALMVIQPWLPATGLLALAVSDLIFVNLWWGILNLLPIAGLDGGHILADLFLLRMGPRGRTPGEVLVAVCSVAIAVFAAVTGFVYLALVILLFALIDPSPYTTLWRVVGGGRRQAGSPRPPGWGRQDRSGDRRPESRPREEPRGHDHGHDRGSDRAAVAGPEAKRVFAATYAETLPDTGEIDADEFAGRPAPLLADVAGMVARREDPGVAARLGAETDPLAVFWIVVRVVEGQRTSQLLSALRRGDSPDRTDGLRKAQVAFHALGRYADALAAASILGRAGGAESALLEARSAARSGDRKRTAAALERVVSLGPRRLSDSALGDIARVGPDRRIGELLTRLRDAAPTS
jgi:Zn-dependent protease